VPTGELNSIPGLEDKHLRALARHQVNRLRDFPPAGQRVPCQARETSGHVPLSERSHDGKTTPGAGWRR
jgi:hypothetical protein